MQPVTVNPRPPRVQLVGLIDLGSGLVEKTWYQNSQVPVQVQAQQKRTRVRTGL